jgi:hypothetical protein
MTPCHKIVIVLRHPAAAGRGERDGSKDDDGDDDGDDEEEKEGGLTARRRWRWL